MTVPSVHPAGLARIILINSYIHSETGPDFFEFDFQGHTQVNGANGSGKTSLLKLIPFFYGIEPGRITSSSGVRKNFAGYYLPYADSAIIFEYYAGTGQLVHVAVTNAARDSSSRGLVYRFVPCPFEAKDVVVFDSTSKQYRIRDWSSYKQVLRARGIKSESLVYSVDAYRSIIQNIATSDNARLRAEYSLSNGRRELRFIDGIALSLITGRISFDNIKLLLTEILRRDHSEIHLELRESDIVTWCNDAAAFRAVEEHREKLEKAAAAGGSYRTSLENLRIGAARLEKLSLECKNRLIEETEKQNETEKARNACRESSEHRHADLTAKVAAAETRMQAQAQKVEALEEMQAHFEEENAATWMHELENRTEALAEATRCRSLLTSATSQVADIRHEFELRKGEVERVYLKRKAELEQNASLAREKAVAEHAENDRRFREDNDKARASSRERTDNLRSRMSELKSKADKLTFMVEHAQATPELEAALEDARQAEQHYYEEVRAGEKELRALGAKRTELLRSRDEKAHQLEKLTLERNNLKIKLDDLKRRAEASQGSLLAFLSENVPAWEEAEGRLLSSDLLMRQDLNPRLASTLVNQAIETLKDEAQREEAQAQVLPASICAGRVLLDVSALPKAQTVTDETMAQMASMAERIKVLNVEVKATEASIASIEDENSALSGRILELERLVSTDDKLDELKTRVAMVSHDIEEYIKNQQASLLAEAENVKRELRAVTAECEKADEALRQALGERNDAYLLNKSDIELRTNSALDSINQSLSDLTTSHSAEVARLKAVEHDRLTEGHVDEKLLTELEQASEKAQARVAAMDAHAGLVSEYKTWLAQAGGSLGDERSQLSLLKRELHDAQVTLHDAETEMKYVLDGMKRELEAAMQAVRQDTELQNRIKSLQGRLADQGIKPSVVMTGEDVQASTVLQDIASELTSFSTLSRNLKEILDDVAGTMARFPQNVICACWEQARDPGHADCDFTGIEDFTQKRIILDTAAARVLIESTLPAQKRSLIDNARNISHMITEYYHHLREFDARIQAFSGRISEIVRGNLQFEAFDSFNVRLEPCITRLAGWDSMKEIAEYYASWESSGSLRGELPSEDFTTKMLDFARRFVNGQLKNEMSDLFSIVFEVVENGKFKRAQSARELEELSSNGLTFLLMCALYISLINETRGGRNITIHWPVDEMSKLSGRNVHILLEVMDKNNIAMVSAAPDLSTAVAVQFKSIYRIAKDGVYVNAEAVNPVGAALARYARKDSVANFNQEITKAQLAKAQANPDTQTKPDLTRNENSLADISTLASEAQND